MQVIYLQSTCKRLQSGKAKDWKPEPVFFPGIGKFRGNFSEAWKNEGGAFQSLEKRCFHAKTVK
jgi:hypothetical protein